MNKTLSKAIFLTYQKYGTHQVETAIKEAIKNGELDYFTDDENARTELEIRNPDNFKLEIFRKYVEYVLNSNEPKHYLESAIQKTYDKYEKTEGSEVAINLVINCLKDLYEGKNHFTRDEGQRELIDSKIKSLPSGFSIQDWMLDTIVPKVALEVVEEEKFKSKITSPKVEIYPENITRLREAMISGLTYDKEGSIQIENMQAATTIGNKRDNQEDAVLLMVHPQNPKFKMMVVSDGMGGANLGEEASHTVVEEIKKWFMSLPPEYYRNVRDLQNLLEQKIKEISNKIYGKHFGNSGATFVGAIVGEKETLISNVGDSRGYMLKGKELIPITKDHSVVQFLHELGQIEKRDDMRFHRNSNQITQCVGLRTVNPTSYIKDNKDYDMLFLFSDGVTDCLSDEQILTLTKTTDKKQLAERILQKALTNKSMARREIATHRDYYSQIAPGKDNTTAAILFNEENNDDERY